MCFTIDHDAKPWTRTTVWKYVKKDGASAVSTSDPASYARVGKVIRCSEGSTYRRSWCGTKTVHGIYVYATLKAARLGVRIMFGATDTLRFVKLTVDPKHFLHAADTFDGEYVGAATYRRVTVASKLRK